MTICAAGARQQRADAYYDFVDECVHNLASSERRLFRLDTDYEIISTEGNALHVGNGGDLRCTLKEMIQARATNGFNSLHALSCIE